MADLRTKKTFDKYLRLISKGWLEKGCNLCKKQKIIKKFKYWKIIPNIFPYDRIAKVNHMILPKRHVAEEELNKFEKKEFQFIKSKYLNNRYEFFIEGAKRIKSIPGHFHIHLIVTKDKI